MTESKILADIKNVLEKNGVPCAQVENDPTLLNGFCLLDGESVPYGFVINARADYVVIYMVASYGQEAFKNDDLPKKILYVNMRLLKGQFNCDFDEKKLVYKYLIENHVEELSEESIKKLVLLPAAMIKKYKSEFVVK